MLKKIAVILSGCGFRDGAEITESISTLIALGAAGAQYQIFAPNLEFAAIDHMSGTTMKESRRNLLVEAARIARGQIHDLNLLKEKDFDGLVLPGGYGVAHHLSSWAHQGANCEVLPHLKNLLVDFHAASKPIGAICIAPVLVARVLGSFQVTLTIGHDTETISEILKTGAQHIECPEDDFITDRLHKIISTPAYMVETQAHLVFKGIQGLINELVEMA